MVGLFKRMKFASIIPINECGAKFDMVVDGISAKGDIKTLVQLYYESENLKIILKICMMKILMDSVDLKISCDDLKEFISKDYIKPNGSILLKQNPISLHLKKDNGLLIKIFLIITHLIQDIQNVMLLLMESNQLQNLELLQKSPLKKMIELQNYLRENDGKEVNVELKIDHFNFEDFVS